MFYRKIILGVGLGPAKAHMIREKEDENEKEMREDREVLNQLRLPLYNPVTEEASDPKFAIHRPEELYYHPVELRYS